MKIVRPWFAIVAAVAVVACSPSKPAESPEQSTARDAVVAVAEAVRLGDVACGAAVELVLEDDVAVDLGQACEIAYVRARVALIRAESAFATWDGHAGDGWCALSDALAALGVLRELVGALADVPRGVDVALEMGSLATDLCSVKR